jgi:DNA (cytosine-5)-methyltransferase 1
MKNPSPDKPILKILDLFCGAGGCSVGYYRAAQQLGLQVHITGVDKASQFNYPFDFVKGDAIEFANQYGHLYDFISASPPCQQYSVGTSSAKSKGKVYPNLLPSTLAALLNLNKPFVIENVPPAIPTADLRLNGQLFNLPLIRWRHFIIHELFIIQPELFKIRGKVLEGSAICGAGLRSNSKLAAKFLPPGLTSSNVLQQWQYAFDAPWMQTRREIKESIPPAYTEFIGLQAFPQITPLAA